MAKGKKGRIAPELLKTALSSIADLAEGEMVQASPEELLVRAASLAAEFDFDAAASHFKEALLRSSGRPDVVEAFAHFLVDEAGWVDHALALFSVQGCAEGPTCHRLYARTLAMADRMGEALDQWTLVNQEEPDQESLFAESTLLLKKGALKEAAAAVDRYRQLAGANESWRTLDQQLKEALPSFWRQETAEVARMLSEHAPMEQLVKRLATWSGVPGVPPDAVLVREQVESLLGATKAAEAAQQAAQLLEAGEVSQALSAARKAVELAPDSLEARRVLSSVEHAVAESARQALQLEAQRRFATTDPVEAVVWLAGRSLPRMEFLSLVPPQHMALAELALDLGEHLHTAPTATQLQAAATLGAGSAAQEAGRLEEAEMVLARTERLLAGFPPFEHLQDRVRKSRLRRRQEEADALCARAAAAFGENRLEEAADLLKRAAALEDVTLSRDSWTLNDRVQTLLKVQREAEATRKRLHSLLESENYFEALGLLENSSLEGLTQDELEPAFARITTGIRTRWPWSSRSLPPVAEGSEYRSESQGIKGIPSDQSLRVLVPYPGSDVMLLTSGLKAWVISLERMEMLSQVELPPQANLDDQKGVILGDKGPNGETIILFIHLGNDSLLDFRISGTEVLLHHAATLSSLLPPAKGAYNRWFAPLGSDERFIVCQSSPDGASNSRLLSVPLSPGRTALDMEANYPLGHLRRVGQTPNLLMIHRLPNPMAMRMPGYFSFAFMDERLKLTERFHIPPSQLDNVLIEATRWLRLGQDGSRIYALFSYYEGMTGQLIQRPLAFVAMERDGSLLYAVSDSSTLVQNHGDLEPTAEVTSWNDRDYLACVTRKQDVQSLALVDLATFKLVRRWECPDGERMLTVVRGREPGSVICVSLVKSTGTVRMRRHSVAEALR